MGKDTNYVKVEDFLLFHFVCIQLICIMVTGYIYINYYGET